jgi:hypothetical protein
MVLGLLALAVALSIVGIFVVRSAERQFGNVGTLVGVGAGIICFVGTAAALMLTRPTGSSSRDTQRLFGSILARTGVPIIACVVLAAWSRLPLQAVFGMVLAYYLVALSLETWLAVQLVRRGRTE